MTVMTASRIRRVQKFLDLHALSRLYCPHCGAYLEGGDGELKDCGCGWKQPINRNED